MIDHRTCNGMGCYPSSCGPGECVLASHPGCAEEGAQPAITTGAGLTPQQQAALAEAERDPWLWRLLPAAVVLGVVLSYCWPLGFSPALP